MDIDGITRTEITHRKKIVILHDQHIVSFKTSLWLLDVIGRGVYDMSIEKYVKINPFKFLSVKCPCATDDEIPCKIRLNISDFFDTVNMHLINKSIKRNIFKKVMYCVRDPKQEFLKKKSGTLQ